MALNYLRRKNHDDDEIRERRIEPRLGPELRGAKSEVFDSGRKTIVDCAHVKVERLETHPILFSKVFKEFEDWKGQKYDYRYWAERENFFLREFLKKQNEFTHVVQARHLISENEAAKQVLTCDAGITIANWLRVKSRYTDTATLSHPFQRSDAFLRLIRACLVALKQIHDHRIVHCDIKEDNICIPYAPNPFPGEGRKIHLEFEKLKLIDFAFSIAHAIPLTQILVINPDERVPYQSELLISALRSDRRSGSPNAVQQLDYRVDLFSLGYMAEKISAAGLDCPPGPGDSGALEDVRSLVQKLKAFDSAPNIGPLPHDGLIAEIDRLLVETAGLSEFLEFKVDGEWTAEEMAQGRGAGRQDSLDAGCASAANASFSSAHACPASIGRSIRDQDSAAAQPGAGHRGWRRFPVSRSGRYRVAVAIECTHRKERDTACAAFAIVGAGHKALGAQCRSILAANLAKCTRGSRQSHCVAAAKRRGSGFSGGVRGPHPAHDEQQAGCCGDSRVYRGRIWRRIGVIRSPGEKIACIGPLDLDGEGRQHVCRAARRRIRKNYDEVKQTVAKSVWWVRGQGPQPEEAARWMENGELLAENGDRPAMLDLAFAMGHGRALKQDRVTSVETYLKVIAHSDGGDEISTRIRQSAVRGLAAMLNIIVEQKDQDAAKRLLPALESKADSGAADMQYYLGLLSECVTRPANLDAARQWYRKAAADPAWKRTADHKARLLGRWCPRRSI